MRALKKNCNSAMTHVRRAGCALIPFWGRAESKTRGAVIRILVHLLHLLKTGVFRISLYDVPTAHP
jgi:hypothetical protein